jgi:hypothetical protein
MKRLIRMICLAVLWSMAGQLQAGVIIEDFEDGNISEYTVVGAGLGDTVSGAYAHDGSFGLGTDSLNWLYRNDAPVQLSRGDTFSAWIEFANLTEGRAYFGFGSSSAGTLSFVLAPNTGEILFQENAAFGFSNIGSASHSFVANQWYRAEVVWGATGSLTGNLYGSDGTTLLNTVNASSSLYTSGGIAFRGFSGVKAFDTVEIQSSVAAVPEPASIAIWGLGALGMGLVVRRKKKLA